MAPTTEHGSIALPSVVAWLGYGGLLPFVGLAVAPALEPAYADFWAKALVNYGAVILSFVGALHWGFAISLTQLSSAQRQASFLWSIVPALLAWPATLLPATGASAILMAGFVAHYWQDRRLARAVNLPAWFLPLRARLTSVACASLLAGGLTVAL